MINPDSTVDDRWQANCVLQILNWLENEVDPYERFKEWLDEAGAGDEEYVVYAMKAWFELRNASALTREILRRQCRNWLSDHPHSRPL